MGLFDWLRPGRKTGASEVRHSPQPVAPASEVPDANEPAPTDADADVWRESADPDVRALLGELGLADQDWMIAYEGLEQIGARAVVPLTLTLRSNNDLLRARAIDLLGRIGDARATEALEQAAWISLDAYKRLSGIAGDIKVTHMAGMRLEIPASELWEEYRDGAKKALDSIQARIGPAPAGATPEAAAESEGEDLSALLGQLGRRDLLGVNPAIAGIRARGEAAVPALLRLCDSGDVTVVEDAIHLLGEIGATEAVPKLKTLAGSQWAEISQASLAALARLGRQAEGGLRVDRNDLRSQVGQLWTAIIQRREQLYPPEELNAFCEEAMAAIPGLSFASNDDKARTWGMLGSLTFKSMHPEWPGGFDGMQPCPAAKRCYDEAFRCDGDSWWKQWADRVAEPETRIAEGPPLSAS